MGRSRNDEATFVFPLKHFKTSRGQKAFGDSCSADAAIVKVGSIIVTLSSERFTEIFQHYMFIVRSLTGTNEDPPDLHLLISR